MNVKKRVKAALATRLFGSGDHPAQWGERESYTRQPEDVLVPGVELAQVRGDLERGDGSELEPRTTKSGVELPPKFHAAHSSAGLAVNTFGPFRSDPEKLTFASHTGFRSLEFELPLATGTGGRAANLDVCLTTADSMIGVESKLSGCLSPRKAEFSSKYEKIVRKEADRHWRSVYEGLGKKPGQYRWLDAAQLVKHYLGLKQADGPGKRELIYLFWEPMNATAFDAYREHAAEAENLARRLRRSRIPLRILRYSEVWQEMGTDHPRHVEHLRRRYQVVI